MRIWVLVSHKYSFGKDIDQEEVYCQMRKQELDGNNVAVKCLEWMDNHDKICMIQLKRLSKYNGLQIPGLSFLYSICFI